MTTSTGPKIGTIDIETAPIEGRTWGLYDQNIGLNQIVTEWAILSFCYKPFGGDRRSVIYMDTSSKEDPRDDYELCAALWELLHDNDILITQNGKRFDLRKIRARLIMHGFPPPSPVKVEDTMLMARQVAAFTSNKLEWLSEYLSKTNKSKHKAFPGFELWSECLAGNPKAWAAMRKYNIPDVLATEQVYLRLRPWVRGHTNLAVYLDGETMVCPVCASKKLREDGFMFTNVGKYKRYNCGGCGAWSRSRYTLNSIAKRRTLLTN
jgi:hypothetical protein